MTSEYKYSDARPEAWVKDVRNYLVGRCWEVHVLPTWAEDAAENGAQPMKLTPAVLEACRGNPQISHRVCSMTRKQARTLNSRAHYGAH